MVEKSLEQIIASTLKRTYELFASPTQKLTLDKQCQQIKLLSKTYDKHLDENSFSNSEICSKGPFNSKLELSKTKQNVKKNESLRNYDCPTLEINEQNWSTSAMKGEIEPLFESKSSTKLPEKSTKPTWHPPWNCYRVISGHLGWVRSVAFDPMNEWFCTGSSDRTIKVWETATGKLKLTLTGHIEQVTDLAVSQRQPYMFSCGLDKMVKCWDLEYNKVIRNYHGHLSGVYCLSIHPVLDLIFSGGRDSVCRVWDMRTKSQIHCLSGHDNTLGSMLTRPVDPQVITGSYDSSIRLWDLRKGESVQTLTFHKKGVRALAAHPKEFTFCSASADNIKKFKLPNGYFVQNMIQQQRCIVNTLAVNEDGVLVSGGDNGSIWFWDYISGNCFQQQQTVVQPGSLDSEAGILASIFDKSGTRLITCEADKTIKMWKEDEKATPETHPSF
jgi:pleiotropic regulator 1